MQTNNNSKKVGIALFKKVIFRTMDIIRDNKKYCKGKKKQKHPKLKLETEA